MREWIRIGDDKLVPFGRRAMQFRSPHWGIYEVHVDETEQDWIKVTTKGAATDWPVYWKGSCDGIFKLAEIGGPAGPDAWWFELELSSSASMEYWGDRVLLWVDHELRPQV